MESGECVIATVIVMFFFSCFVQKGPLQEKFKIIRLS